MWNHPIGRVRLVGLIEGISFLLLLGVAMPLKYLADMPLAVRIVGMAHGVLFIGLVFAVGLAKERCSWSTAFSVRIVVAALLPFGPFVVDRELKRRQLGGG